MEMADTLVADCDVVELAHRLAAHRVHLLPVASAGLVLTDERDQLRLPGPRTPATIASVRSDHRTS